MHKLPYLGSCHRIVNLRSAKFSTSGPFGDRETKLKGSRAKGKTYERTLARSLKRMLDYHNDGTYFFYNPWISFEDWCEEKKSFRPFWCQPDFLIVFPKEKVVVILEAKLTQTATASDQLFYLYQPLVEKLFPDFTTRLVLVCKNIKVQVAEQYRIRFISELLLKDPTIMYTMQCISTLNYKGVGE